MNIHTLIRCDARTLNNIYPTVQIAQERSHAMLLAEQKSALFVILLADGVTG